MDINMRNDEDTLGFDLYSNFTSKASGVDPKPWSNWIIVTSIRAPRADARASWRIAHEQWA